MNFLMLRRHAPLLVFLSSLCLIGWLWAVPTVISRSTFAAVMAFVIGGAAVSLITWRNAQATGSMGQLLHATEAASGNVELRQRLTARDGSEPAATAGDVR